MGTSSKKGTSKKLKEILNRYIDTSTNSFKPGQEEVACKEFTRKYLTQTRSSKGYFNPEKMSSMIQVGFGGLKKFSKKYENTDSFSEEELKEKVNEFVEEDDELLTEEDEVERNAFIAAMTKAILATKDKDRIFIETMILNIIKLGVFSEFKENILEVTNGPISLEKIKEEIEKAVKDYLKDSMDEIYEKTLAGDWKAISKIIENIKKKLKREDKNV